MPRKSLRGLGADLAQGADQGLDGTLHVRLDDDAELGRFARFYLGEHLLHGSAADAGDNQADPKRNDVADQTNTSELWSNPHGTVNRNGSRT